MGCILIVDDRPETREMIQQDLTTAGYTVRTADSGPTAIEAVREHQPGVLLLDADVPGMTSPEFLDIYRQIPEREAPTVLLTAKEGAMQRWLDLRTDGLLVRPYRRATLQELVSRFILPEQSQSEASETRL